MVSKVTTQWSLKMGLIEVFSFILIITSPLLVLFYWICYQFFNTSISSTAFTAYSEGTFQFLGNRMPSFDMESVLAYGVWTLFQAMLYLILPGTPIVGSADAFRKTTPLQDQWTSCLGIDTGIDVCLTLFWISSFDVHCRTLGGTCLDRKYIQSGHAYYLPSEGLLLAR